MGNRRRIRLRRDPRRWDAAQESRAPHRWEFFLPCSELDDLRHRLHLAFDKLWRSRKARRFNNRAAAYAWLASTLGLSDAECHIGLFDAETCRRALEAVRSIGT